MRQDKAQAFFGIAEAASKLSKDPSTKVGCVMLDPETLSVNIIGYNGFPRGFNDKIEKRWHRPDKYSFVTHSEMNAISLAARNGVPLNGSICVVTHFPCCDCVKLLIQSGISSIVTKKPSDDMISRWGESFKYSKLMLEETGIDVQYV